MILTSDSVIEEDWKPKYGERIKVFNKVFNEWRTRTFVVKHNGLFFCEAKDNKDILVSYELAKPLK